LAIASRLGLSKEITGEARGLLSPEDLEVESLLDDIKRAREDAVAANQAAQEARAEAERMKQELEDQLMKIEEDRREILNRARHQARIELGQVRKELHHISKAAKPQARPQHLVEARTKLKELEEAVPPPEPPVKPLPIDRGKLELGTSVWVRELRQKGEITDFLSEEEVEVGVGKFRVKARLDDLELVEEEPPRKREETLIVSPPPTPTPMSLQLRGQRAEEAIIELGKYLDRAYMARLPMVRIVHGKGTGTLRRAVREELENHPLVASHRPGGPEEGGDGVTIAELIE
jgi:DNA mismatch repair protein MutS2